MFCERCGKQMEETNKFCPYCGAAVPNYDLDEDFTWLQEDSQIEEPDDGRKKTGLMIALGVMLLVIAGTVVFLVSGGIDLFQSGRQIEKIEAVGGSKEDNQAEEVQEEEVQEEEVQEEEAQEEEESADTFVDVPGIATGILNGSEEVYMAQFDASASSILKEAGYNYSAVNLSDLDPSTCWADGVAGNGVNESILFTCAKPQKVSGIAIMPGFFKNSELYYKNCAPSKIRVECDDETVFTFEVPDTKWDFNGSMSEKFCYFDFGEEVITDECKVTILSVREGTKYSDCCISEMFLYK